MLLQLGSSCTVRALSHGEQRGSVQVECFGTRTTAATEALVLDAMASGRGARFASGLTVTEGGCREPR